MKTILIGSDKAKNNNEVKNNNRPSLTGKEAKNEPNENKATAKLHRVRQTKPPKQRPILPLQWINPQTLQKPQQPEK